MTTQLCKFCHKPFIPGNSMWNRNQVFCSKQCRSRSAQAAFKNRAKMEQFECECGRGPKLSLNKGCAKCEAMDTEYQRQQRASAELRLKRERDEYYAHVGMARFVEQWVNKSRDKMQFAAYHPER